MNYHSGFTSLGPVVVSAEGRTDGIVSQVTGAGNYEIRNLNAGQLQIVNDGGPLVLTSASSVSLHLQAGGGTKVLIGADGNTYFQQNAIKGIGSGTALAPSIAFSSETSLGLFRSANSSLQLSYGTFSTRGGALSFRTTNSSGSASNLTNGEFALISVSATSAQLAYRSGNTVYIFNAVQASP
jgi:hypothetical protein